MINIQITPADFEYDVQSLVQAFYPGEAFKVNKLQKENSSDDRAVSCDDRKNKASDNKSVSYDDRKNKASDNKSVIEETERQLSVHFTENQIIMEFDDGAENYREQTECDFSDRRETKNVLKKALYQLFVRATGSTLAWGNLTGIRPAKIPSLLMEQGKTTDEIKAIMRETYLISEEKLELSMEIAGREKNLLDRIPYKEGYSLYVGIPFCPTTCLYCSFTSYPIDRYNALTDAYVDAVIKEMKYVGKALADKTLNSVYIGGGTPTTLSAGQLERLITGLKKNFDFKNVVEFTVEAGRPDSITREKLVALKENGVDRISINPQTMNQDTLDLIGRKHTVGQVVEKFKLAREVGFTNINMDLIMGLPEEDEDKVINTLEEIKALAPDSLTVHSLALKRAARLNIQKEKYESMKMENNLRLMELSEKYARAMGMKPYYLYRQKNMAGNQENVGYSREGCEGIYNILMMGDKQNIVALGAGATTKMMSKDRLSATRIDNVKNVELYIQRIDEMIDRKREYFEGNDFYF